jgi:hypothetical protein
VFFGKAGSSDILGILPGGRFIAVECKSSGGRLSDNQRKFLKEIEKMGGVAIVAKSIDDIEKTFKRLGILQSGEGLGGYMDVLKFKHVGDIFFVQYEENKDIKTIKTEDGPENELWNAMDNVAIHCLKLFNISDSPCKLQEISWKDGDKAGSKCVLLSGEIQFGQFKIALPKVSSQEAETPEEGIYDPGEKKNQYNRAVDILRSEVKRFAEGSRRQRPLPFTDEEDEGKEKKGIFRAAADKAAGLFGRQA